MSVVNTNTATPVVEFGTRAGCGRPALNFLTRNVNTVMTNDETQEIKRGRGRPRVPDDQKKKSVVIVFRIDTETNKQLKSMQDKYDVSVNAILKTGLVQYLKRLEALEPGNQITLNYKPHTGWVVTAADGTQTTYTNSTKAHKAFREMLKHKLPI